eukprot:TRINITY_DN72_c0_g1_i11.p1 TRINITY_DN72_c0_g1~~TRINITY_DN72_c0_g1_i11.p1  ORF type:complete len:112 (-),score=43.64 TRINITY_DN72_c0_g1_i11:133-468(-)
MTDHLFYYFYIFFIIFICAILLFFLFFFFFQAEDGIRDLVRSRGLGDVYKRQRYAYTLRLKLACQTNSLTHYTKGTRSPARPYSALIPCLLYTSDAADDLLCVDLGGRRII